MKELDILVARLKEKKEVDAVFLTGSFGVSAESAASDMDLVIILTENRIRLKSVYQFIDNIFADIFFFDQKDLRRILAVKTLDGNSMDGILVSWLLTAKILFDKTGLTTQMKDRAHQISLFVSEKERKDIIQKISYSYLQTTRYYNSGDALYRDALEIRLLHSVIELITGFFTLHGEPWRGEKHATAFMRREDAQFYSALLDYQTAAKLSSKVTAYEKMVERIKYTSPLLDYRQPVCISKEGDSQEAIKTLRAYWEQFIT